MSNAPQILPLSNYPAQVIEKLRYSDADMQGHINNAAFATLFESARVAYFAEVMQSLKLDDKQIVIAQLSISFLNELTWPGEVAVGTSVSHIGRSSFNLLQGIFSHDRCVATADSVIVLTDTASRKSTPLTDPMRKCLDAIKLSPLS